MMRGGDPLVFRRSGEMYLIKGSTLAADRLRRSAFEWSQPRGDTVEPFASVPGDVEGTALGTVAQRQRGERKIVLMLCEDDERFSCTVLLLRTPAPPLAPAAVATAAPCGRGFLRKLSRRGCCAKSDTTMEQRRWFNPSLHGAASEFPGVSQHKKMAPVRGQRDPRRIHPPKNRPCLPPLPPVYRTLVMPAIHSGVI